MQNKLDKIKGIFQTDVAPVDAKSKNPDIAVDSPESMQRAGIGACQESAEIEGSARQFRHEQPLEMQEKQVSQTPDGKDGQNLQVPVREQPGSSRPPTNVTAK